MSVPAEETAAGTEPPWRLRFRAARTLMPWPARDNPERLLYAANPGGVWQLYAWDLRHGQHRRLTERAEGIQAGYLDPAGQRVWWFDDDRGSEYGHWVTQPFTGDAQPAAPELPDGYSAGLALGDWFAVVGLSDDRGTRVHLLRSGRPPQLLYAHRQNARVAGLSRDERLLCLSHSEHGDSRHPALRVVDLNGRVVGELHDGPGLGLTAAGWSRVAGDNRLLVLHERHGSTRPLIWHPQTGETEELPMDLPGEISAAWYPDAAAILLTHQHLGRGELYRLNLQDGMLQRLPTLPGVIWATLVRPDGTVWYGHTSSGEAPRVLAVADGPPAPVLTAAGPIAPAGVRYHDLTVNGISGFLAEPDSSRPHPTVIWVHGGPHSHDRDEFTPRVQAFVDHGLAVALVNYRGSSGHGRAWRDALEGNPGFTELADVIAVRDSLVATGVADERRLALGGGSWGGYLTLLGLGTAPDKWSAGIAAVPVADYVAAFEDEMESLKAFDRALFGGTPVERPEFYRERSPISYVERVQAPVLILAGEQDPRCPIRQIDNYLARLRALGRPHDVYRFNAGHGSLVVDEQIRQMTAMLRFLATALGVPAPE